MTWEILTAFMAKYGIVSLQAGFGGAAYNLYTIATSSKPFLWSLFWTTVFLAIFVGNTVSSFLPHDVPGRDGLIYLSGLMTLPLLRFMEQNGVGWLVSRVFGFEIKEEK